MAQTQTKKISILKTTGTTGAVNKTPDHKLHRSKSFTESDIHKQLCDKRTKFIPKLWQHLKSAQIYDV